jgi:hypothetical protein
MKVLCIKEVSLGSLNKAFKEGEEYDIPSKEATNYPEYFKKLAQPKTKKVETEENK